MALVQRSYGQLYLGVSRQEESNRLDGQFQECENMMLSVEKGVSRRNPLELVKNITLNEQNTFIHAYERGDDVESYIISIGTSGVQVWDKNGNAKTVNTQGANILDYFATTQLPLNSFKALTVGDTTFIVNTTKVPKMGTVREGTKDQHLQHPFYWVSRTFDNGQNTGYEYECSINGKVVTATGTKSTEIAQLIAGKLTEQEALGWTRYGSIVIGTGKPTSFTGSDSYGGQASLACWGTIQDLKKLPNTLSGAENGRNIIINVVGDPENNFTTYWVKYEKGNWVETVQPYLINAIDQKTMPLMLQRQADGTFLLKYIDWGKREKGDEKTAEVPSFIGQPITDLFFFKNRLCLVAGENVCMSQIGEYYNFFPTTVTDVIDSDPIDVAVDSNRVALINHAVPYDDKVILLSTTGQFSLQADKVLSPLDVSISSTTSYASLKNVKPLPLGNVMFFLSASTTGATLMEYYVDETETSTAIELSNHIKGYVPANIINMVGSVEENIIFLLTKDQPNTIYVYKFFNDSNQRIQTAWFKWTFPNATISNIVILGNYLYFLIKRGSTYSIERLDYAVAKTYTSYKDIGTTNYKSYIELSKMLLRDSNENLIQNARSPLVYRTIQLASTPNSKYKLIFKQNMNNNGNNLVKTREVANFGIKDNKASVLGKADNMGIFIEAVDNNPLEFHTYTIEATYNSRAEIL